MYSALTPLFIRVCKLEFGFCDKNLSNLSALKPSKLMRRTGFLANAELITEITKATYKQTLCMVCFLKLL